MKRTWNLAVVLGWCALAACASDAPSTDGSTNSALDPQELRSLWTSGDSWEAYSGRLGPQAVEWQRAYDEMVLREDLVARAGVLPGSHRILAISERGCAECASTVPAMARLAERVPGVELRVIAREQALAVYGDELPVDALPLVVVLDEAYRPVGCWARSAATADVTGARALNEVLKIMEATEPRTASCPR